MNGQVSLLCYGKGRRHVCGRKRNVSNGLRRKTEEIKKQNIVCTHRPQLYLGLLSMQLSFSNRSLNAIGISFLALLCSI